MIEEILSILGLNSEEAKIYLFILEHGGETAGELAKKLSIVRPTMYNYLQRMTEKGVIKRTLKHGVRSFVAEPPKKLDILFSTQLKTLQSRHDDFRRLLPELQQLAGGKMLKPRFQLFEGQKGIQHVFNEILLCRDIETLSFWPVRSMINALSPEFLSYHNKQRIQNNVSIRAVWPLHEAIEVKDFPFMGIGPEFKRTIRLSPPEIVSSLGYWIYGNNVAFLSSQKESFGYIIESAEMVGMLTTQFNFIWQYSSPLKVPKTDMQPFIDELKGPQFKNE